MQTPKSKATPLEVPSKSSPKTPRTTHQLKTPGSGSGSEPVSSSPSKASRANKDRSPKVAERKAPLSPAAEKKRSTKAPDLESQIAQLQEDLKQAKDKLISSELLKEKAEMEADEAKRRLSAMTTKLEDTERQVMEFSGSEESRVQDLYKISHDHDTSWESELDAAQKQHSVDSAALASALNEINKLKMQVDMEAESNAGHADYAYDEIHRLKLELHETRALAEKLKVELRDSKESENKVLEKLNSNHKDLQSAMENAEYLKLESLKATEDHNALAAKLEESRNQVIALEILVNKLQTDFAASSGIQNSLKEQSAGHSQPSEENGHNEEIEQLKSEIMNMKYEDCKLKAALDAAEMKYQEERIQSSLDIRTAYVQLEREKSDLSARESELEAKLKKAYSDIDELKLKLIESEIRLQSLTDKQWLLNEEENERRKQFEINFAALHEALLTKETSLEAVVKENEILKLEIQKRDLENTKLNDVARADSLADARVAVNKIEYLTEESDKSSKRTTRVIEQLDAAQAANAELESELRKLKVQSDQWRKAAEAAAAMLTTGNSGKYMDRTGSLDSGYHTLGGRISSPFSDDLNDESLKKKNGNMLKKIGVLWKKNQNQK